MKWFTQGRWGLKGQHVETILFSLTRVKFKKMWTSIKSYSKDSVARISTPKNI